MQSGACWRLRGNKSESHSGKMLLSNYVPHKKIAQSPPPPSFPRHSNAGMARSLVWPRQTDETSWFCAELVAAVLKVGGLMSFDSNPGAATPYSLYKMYSKQGAATANPYVLTSLKRINERESLLPISMPRSVSETPQTSTLSISSSRRASPPRAPFRILNTRSQNTQPGSVQLTLNSLR